MNPVDFALIFSAAILASLADTIGAVWSRSPRFDSWWFALLCLISPAVFAVFGYVTSRLGMAITSAIVNSLIALLSIGIGLVAFGDWQRVTGLQYVGMALSLAGMGLMLFAAKHH